MESVSSSHHAVAKGLLTMMPRAVNKSHQKYSNVNFACHFKLKFWTFSMGCLYGRKVKDSEKCRLLPSWDFKQSCFQAIAEHKTLRKSLHHWQRLRVTHFSQTSHLTCGRMFVIINLKLSPANTTDSWRTESKPIKPIYGLDRRL